MNNTDQIRRQLTDAMAAQDPDAFEDALIEAFDAEAVGNFGELLTQALQMPWHTRHEDVARALQEIRSPASINALYAAATTQHDYLAYDDFFGLARKCTWALADIGTPEALMRLKQLAQNTNTLIASYAQKRLDNWDEELSRKRR